MHECDACKISFLNARAKAKHKEGKKHKEQNLANMPSGGIWATTYAGTINKT